MHLGSRGLRRSGTQKRQSAAYRPRAEFLEDKTLLATVQLGAGTTFNLASQTTTPPNGPQTIGGQLPFIADTLTFNSTTSNQTQGNQTTDPGLGVLETGSLPAQGVGYNVAALGDMNGDGSNDFLIGAPTVAPQTNNISLITPSTGTNDQAFLLFGNRSATVPTIQPWTSSSITPEERVGVINNVGGALQT
ncbi:MAG TPA: integrin alpha, partial [Isosphaeraceae bacterium]|nr:integrin alpha [Isosphaeraceae bacterium]